MKIYYAFERKAINFCLSMQESDGPVHRQAAVLARFCCMLAS